MDCVATVADGVVYDDENRTLSSGWSRQDGVLNAFWLISPLGHRWKVKTRFVSTTVIELLPEREDTSYLLVEQGRGIRAVFDSSHPGYELARIVARSSQTDRSTPKGNSLRVRPNAEQVLGTSASSVFGVYTNRADYRAGAPDWLIAAALASWFVDGPRQRRV